jgi:hypothetical protein
LEQVCVGPGDQLLEAVGAFAFGQAEGDRMLRIGSSE